VFNALCKIYDLHWFVLNSKNSYFGKKKFEEYRNIANLTIHYIENNYRQRDPRELILYYKLYKKIKGFSPDFVYSNVAPNPAFAIISVLFFNKNNTIYTAHDGKVQNDSSSFGLMRTFSYNLIYKHSKYVNMFSQAQADLMKKTYPQNMIHKMVLPIKDFGSSEKKKPVDFIRFLSFGSIIYQKNIDLLIEAAEILYNRGYKNFNVSINGGCKNWDFYQSKIMHSEIFECYPHFVSNNDLLNLFASSHYCVFPYRRVSQSGVLKLAFNYNLPVIVSNIGAFKEEVVENTNGFFFEVGNANALANVMEKCLRMDSSLYEGLLERMRIYTKENYSTERVVEQYNELFTSFIK